MESNDDRALLRNNPLFAIGISCLLAGLMFAAGLFSYYRSDTKNTIEQIQKNNSLSSTGEQTDATMITELSAEYLDQLETKIGKQISSHDDEAEFSSSELTDSALGL